MFQSPITHHNDVYGSLADTYSSRAEPNGKQFTCFAPTRAPTSLRCSTNYYTSISVFLHTWIPVYACLPVSRKQTRHHVSIKLKKMIEDLQADDLFDEARANHARYILYFISESNKGES